MAAEAIDLTGDHGLRDIADRLLEVQRVEYLHEEVLTFVATPGLPHARIVNAIVGSFAFAKFSGASSVPWYVSSENFPWNYRDVAERFSIPDLVVAYPEFENQAALQDSIELIAEITSPGSDTVENDVEHKPKRYAKGGVPLYLLVDQELAVWRLHRLIEGRPRYEVVAEGGYGDPIDLPEPFGFRIETAEWPSHTP